MNKAVLYMEIEKKDKEIERLKKEIEQLSNVAPEETEPETPEESAPCQTCAELTAENEQLKAENTRLTAENERLNAENNSLRDGVNGLCNELTAEIARLSKELAEAQAVSNPPRQIFDAAAAAEYCGMTVSAMQNLRTRNQPPPFQKVSGRIEYKREDLDAWIASRSPEQPQEPEKEDSTPEATAEPETTPVSMIKSGVPMVSGGPASIHTDSTPEATGEG